MRASSKKVAIKHVNSRADHIAIDGYFDSVEEYFDAEEILFSSRILDDNLNYNDSGSRTGSFSYAVSPKNLSKVERMIKKLKGTIVSVRAYDRNGNEIY